MRKTQKILVMSLVMVLACSALAQEQPAQRSGAKVSADEDGVLVVDGKKVFPIAVTMPPPLGSKAPSGRDAWQELYDGGVRFLRTGPFDEAWNEQHIEQELRRMDHAARIGLRTMPYLREMASIGGPDDDPEDEAKLRQVVGKFRDHPGLGVWKGADEPEWGNQPVEGLVRARQIIEQLDPNHPIWIVQAPRGTEQSLRQYDDTYHITGVDVYPVSYPPGVHSWLPNDDISVVGDHINIMMRVAAGKPVWATLQIAYSGVTPARGRTLRFPTFEQLRYMTYQSIALGARGVIYFGGHIESTLNDRDRELGWNWTFYDRVLRHVLAEIGENSPLYPALIARNSQLPIHAPDLEYVVREVGDDIFIIATRRHGDTKEITFTDLPDDVSEGDVLFEWPRTVTVRRETHPVRRARETNLFTDWFGPFDVHVYRFKRSGESKPQQ